MREGEEVSLKSDIQRHIVFLSFTLVWLQTYWCEGHLPEVSNNVAILKAGV